MENKGMASGKKRKKLTQNLAKLSLKNGKTPFKNQ